MSTQSTDQADASILKGKVDETYENDEAIRNMLEQIFKEKGLKVQIGGCGCCGSPWMTVRFADGTEYETSGFRIDMLDEEDEN